MPSNHLILCHPLLLLFPSIKVFSNESVLRIRWPKYCSFSFSISPSNEHPGLISFRMDWLDLLSVQGNLRVFSNTTVQKHQFFSTQLCLWSKSHIDTSNLMLPGSHSGKESNCQCRRPGFSDWVGKIPWRREWLSSVQFSRSVVSDSLQPHESQHSRPPGPSPTPRVHLNSSPSSQ